MMMLRSMQVDRAIYNYCSTSLYCFECWEHTCCGLLPRWMRMWCCWRPTRKGTSLTHPRPVICLHRLHPGCSCWFYCSVIAHWLNWTVRGIHADSARDHWRVWVCPMDVARAGEADQHWAGAQNNRELYHRLVLNTDHLEAVQGGGMMMFLFYWDCKGKKRFIWIPADSIAHWGNLLWITTGQINGIGSRSTPTGFVHCRCFR